MKRKVTVGGSVLALLIILSAGTFVYTGTPSFCGSCHEMAPLATSWQHSSHARLSCMDCHSEPGMIGNVRTHLGGLGKVFSHFTNPYVIPTAAHVDDALCLDCHRGIENRNVAGDIVMVHGRHMRTDVPCTDCHALITHRDPLSLTRNPAEEDCIGCHLQKDVATECVTCHMQPVALRPTR